MKTQLFLVVALVATLFTQTAFANTNERNFDLGGTTVKISSVEKSVMVNLGSVQKEEILISIEDANGNTLVSESVKNNANFVKKYNVSKLEEGQYFITVTKKTLRTVQPFIVSSIGVTMSDVEKKEKFLPYVIQNGNKLDVNVLLGNYNNITIKILDNEGRSALNDTNYVVLTLHKRFDLSKLPAGNYVAEVTAGDETFYYSIVK
jgi:Secretion system C-terminal sorting domain